MKKVKLTLKIITSMFSFGDNSTEPEFRVTELKSLIRNTFREIFSFKNLKDMKEKEDNLFGNTENKSPVSFKIEKQYMLPHKDKAEIKCLKDSNEIVIYIMSKNNLYLKFYINLLILSSIIGAIGKHSRKGFGSFRVKAIDGIENNKYEDLLQRSPNEILKQCIDYLCKNYSDIYIKRKVDYKKDKYEVLSFDNYKNNNLDFPYVTKINFIKIQGNKKYLNLIKEISQLTHDRLEKKFFYQNINKSILGNYKSSRFASPVSISFWENNTQKYMIIKELNYQYILEKMYINMCMTKYKKISGQEKKDMQKKFKKEYESEIQKVKDFRQNSIKYIDKYIKKVIERGGVNNK